MSGWEKAWLTSFSLHSSPGRFSSKQRITPISSTAKSDVYTSPLLHMKPWQAEPYTTVAPPPPAYTPTAPLPPHPVTLESSTLEKGARPRRSPLRRAICACCCIFFIICVIIAAFVGLAVLYASKLKVNFNGVDPPNPNDIQTLNGDTLVIPFSLKFSVENSNVFGLNVDEIGANGYYKITGEKAPRLIATGKLDNVRVKAANKDGKATKNEIKFPISALYGPTTDPGQVALKDLVSRCGLLPGGKRSKLPMQIKIEVGQKIFGLWTVSGSYRHDIDVDCPLPPNFKNDLLNKLVTAKL